MELVNCTNQYWEFVRTLRMDERVINGFVETIPITTEQQISYMTNNSQYYYIALVDGKPAGYVGVINNDIRVCTHPDFQGMGVGKFMINHIKHIFPLANAKVKYGNEASSNLFLACEFEEIHKDDKFIYYKRKEKMVSLKSSIIKKGRYVSQILHFVGGEKRTFNNVDTHSIKQGQFTKFETADGRLVMVNDKNVLCIEIITE